VEEDDTASYWLRSVLLLLVFSTPSTKKSNKLPVLVRDSNEKASPNEKAAKELHNQKE